MELIEGWVQHLADLSGLHNWAVVVFAIALAAGVLDLVQRTIFGRLDKSARESENLWDDAVTGAVKGPLSLAIWVLAVSIAVLWLPAVGEDGPISRAWVREGREIGMLVALAWFLWRLIRGVERGIIRQGEQRRRQIDPITVQAISRILRIAVVITIGLGILDTLGFSISGLLAAGGIGGIALGLAAKDLLANFFGGLTIYMDRPFAQGDWVRSPDRDIEGVVKEIGWRMTTIMRFDRRPLYVPNSVFTTIAVENPSRMTHRRIKETIGVRYSDIGRMTEIVAKVKEMLQNHEDIASDQTMIVNFDAFSDSSVDFFIYTFTKTTDWITFHGVKQDVLLKVADIIADHDAEIAFPTRSLHIESAPEFAGLPQPGEGAEAGGGRDEGGGS